jgi:hypothetical protein
MVSGVGGELLKNIWVDKRLGEHSLGRYLFASLEEGLQLGNRGNGLWDVLR